MDRCDNCGREYDQTVYYRCPKCNDPNFSPFRHLCETCKLEFTTCKSHPEFGSGKGNDNVCDCDVYIKKGAQDFVSRIDKRLHLKNWKEQRCLNELDKIIPQCGLNCKLCPYGD